VTYVGCTLDGFALLGGHPDLQLRPEFRRCIRLSCGLHQPLGT
jgi:hypothetical protein